MDEMQLRQVARRRVQLKRGFFIHLLIYLAVNGMLILAWVLTGKGYPWFLWVLGGWGIGLFANAVAVAMELLLPEERAIQREIHRLQH